MERNTQLCLLFLFTLLLCSSHFRCALQQNRAQSKNVACFFRGNPWIGSGEQPERDKHARDIPFLDNYSMERWEVGVHMHLIIIVFRLGHQSNFFISNYHETYKNQTKREGFFFFSEELLLCSITLCTLTSLSIFSTLFPICFFWY